MLKAQVELEEYVNKITSSFNNNITYYSLSNNFKPYKTFQNERMLREIIDNNLKQYKIIESHEDITPSIKKNTHFSSVILYTDNQQIEVTSIMNQFIIQEHIIRFNHEMALILKFLTKSDFKIDSVKWGIITKKVEIYNSENISFKIKDENLITI
mgnify:CR=1 FL=1